MLIRHNVTKIKTGALKRARALIAVISIIIILIVPTVESITWFPDEVRLTNYYNFDIMATVTRMKDGRVWVVWTRNIVGDYQLVYNIFDGASWLGETVLTKNQSSDTGASILQTRDGKIWIAWSSDRTGDYDIYHVTSSDNGQSWSDELPLVSNPDGDDLAPQIFEAYNGTLWLVWQSDRDEVYSDIYYKTYNGSQWSNEIRLTTDPKFDRSPSIAEVYIGKIWVIWTSNRELPNGYWQLYYRTYNGVSWSADTKLMTDDTKLNTDPSIFWTVDNKTLYVFWSMRKPTSTATDDIYYKYSLDEGATWSSNIQFTTDSYDDVWSYGTQAKVKERNVWIVWTSNRYDQTDGNYEIVFRKSVAIWGDANGDLAVTVMDLALVGKHFGKRIPNSAYNPGADLDNDGKIWGMDLAIVGKYYGTHA